MKTFTAGFFSPCAADCGDPIRPGHDAQFTPTGAVIHTQCAPDATERPPRPACPWCRIELPISGACCA